MRKKYLVFGIIMAMLLALGLSGCGGGNTQKEYTADDPLVFRLAHVEATDSILNQSAEKWKEYVEKESGGKIKVEIYPNGELGGYDETIESIRADSVQMTMAPTSSLSTYDPKLALLDLPFMFKDAQAMDAAIKGEVGDLYKSWMDEAGFYCAGFQYDGARGISNSTRPVKTVKDLKGLKIRVMQNDMYIDIFKALGANPTPMSFNDLYTGLQQGTVDGQDNSPMLTYVNKFYEVQKYYSTLDTVYCNSVLLCNKTFMESLPEDLLKILQDGSDEYLVNYQRETAMDMEKEYLEDLDKNGCAVTYIDDKTEFKKAVESVYEKYRKDLGEDVVNEIVDSAAKY